jgi:hypothetical protein
MKLFKKISLVLVILIVSCSYRQPGSVKVDYSNLSKDEILQKVNEFNKTYCNYEKKARIMLKNEYINREFKGLIRNDCNNLYVNVLGPFNRRVLAVRVVNNVIYLDEKDKLDKGIKALLEKDSLKDLLNIFKIPNLLPDKKFAFHVLGDYYLFSKKDKKVFINDRLLIYMIENGNNYIRYEYNNDNKVNEIIYKDNKSYLKIKFL